MTPPGGDEETAPPAGAEVASLEADDPASVTGERSLVEDVEALIDDGKTYLEAELAYQKTRAAFVAEKAKGAVIFGAVAAAFAFLALIGLTVGLILSLSPLLTPWGASALVVALLVIGAVIAVRAAGRHWNKLMSAIDTAPEDRP